MISFASLRGTHPAAHAHLLAETKGDRDLAEVGWIKLQENVHERLVLAERERCLQHIELAALRGDIASAKVGIVTGQPAYVLPACEQVPLRTLVGEGESIAQVITRRALLS